MDIWADFKQRRDDGNSKVMEADFLPFKRFYNLDTLAYQEGAINEKSKELIGLACSLVLRCNDCVLYHIERCFLTGSNKSEITEAMNIALVISGSIVIPHLRFAYQAIAEYEEN